MSNAFNTSGPSTVLKSIPQKTVKQMVKDANRKNQEAPLCTFVPAEKAQKMRKAAI
jgi:hypothetical protein